MPYDRTDRMTAAELDLYIAERMKHLPKWWESASEKIGERPTKAKRIKTRRVGKVRKLATREGRK